MKMKTWKFALFSIIFCVLASACATTGATVANMSGSDTAVPWNPASVASGVCQGTYWTPYERGDFWNFQIIFAGGSAFASYDYSDKWSRGYGVHNSGTYNPMTGELYLKLSGRDYEGSLTGMVSRDGIYGRKISMARRYAAVPMEVNLTCTWTLIPSVTEQTRSQ